MEHAWMPESFRLITYRSILSKYLHVRKYVVRSQPMHAVDASIIESPSLDTAVEAQLVAMRGMVSSQPASAKARHTRPVGSGLPLGPRAQIQNEAAALWTHTRRCEAAEAPLSLSCKTP